MANRALSGSARLPVSVNRASRAWGFPDLAEIWRYRELLLSFTARDLKVRYKQTALGAAWAVLQPFATMVVFSVFFSHLIKLPIGGVPYPVFIYVALVPWIYFANTLARIGGSLVEQQGIITKVYFPRLLIPIAITLAGLVDLAITCILLVALMAFYHLRPSGAFWTAPLFLGLAMVTAFSVGLWLAALNVEYRDIQQIVPFLLQTWMFATPIFYPALLVRLSLREIYGLNPTVGVVEGFRWSLLGGGPASAPGSLVFISALVVLGILLGGLVYFRHVEETFADVV